jgi:hypothetical protein
MQNPILTLVTLTVVVSYSSCGASAQRSQSGQPAQPVSEQAPGRIDSRAPVDPNKFALIIAGVGGEEAYARRFIGQASQLYEALTSRYGFDERHTFLLTESPTGGPEQGGRENVARSTADEVRKAFAAIKAAANAESMVVVVMIGHGSFDTQQAKFNLVGPDLSAKDYTGLLDALPTRRVLVINCASSSGEFIKPLSSEGRIVITATRSGSEQNATVFADNLIKALTDEGADADKNGRLSVVEAFNYATKLTADWYKQRDRLATEHALIDDNGDGTGHEEATAGDGSLAKVTYLDSKAIVEAGSDAELVRLLGQRQKLEEEIEKLKARKEQMKEEDYTAELERLLVELARVNQAIKARQKN